MMHSFDIRCMGPSSYIFGERNHSVTVLSGRYVEMLQTLLKPNLNDLRNQNVWFQQDGATAHTARRSMQALREMFPGRLVSLRGGIQWTTRSPDLNPCDCFLWGYLKAEVYKDRPLNDAIRLKIAEIPLGMTLPVMENFRNHLRQCLTNGVHYLEDVIFKT